MRRRDFLSGHWAPCLLQAAQLRPAYRCAALTLPRRCCCSHTDTWPIMTASRLTICELASPQSRQELFEDRREHAMTIFGLCLCSEPTNGAEVVAARLAALGHKGGVSGSGALDHAGSVRLRDSVVWGFCMQRVTRRKSRAPVRLQERRLVTSDAESGADVRQQGACRLIARPADCSW